MTEAINRGIDAVAIHRNDNVATLLRDASAGEVLSVAIDGAAVAVTCTEAIRLCHKIALITVNAGDAIIKYGEVIGEACEPIATGELVHVHNMRSRRGLTDKP